MRLKLIDARTENWYKPYVGKEFDVKLDYFSCRANLFFLVIDTRHNREVIESNQKESNNFVIEDLRIRINGDAFGLGIFGKHLGITKIDIICKLKEKG